MVTGTLRNIIVRSVISARRSTRVTRDTTMPISTPTRAINRDALRLTMNVQQKDVIRITHRGCQVKQHVHLNTSFARLHNAGPTITIRNTRRQVSQNFPIMILLRTTTRLNSTQDLRIRQGGTRHISLRRRINTRMIITNVKGPSMFTIRSQVTTNSNSTTLKGRVKRPTQGRYTSTINQRLTIIRGLLRAWRVSLLITRRLDRNNHNSKLETRLTRSISIRHNSASIIQPNKHIRIKRLSRKQSMTRVRGRDHRQRRHSGPPTTSRPPSRYDRVNRRSSQRRRNSHDPRPTLFQQGRQHTPTRRDNNGRRSNGSSDRGVRRAGSNFSARFILSYGSLYIRVWLVRGGGHAFAHLGRGCFIPVGQVLVSNNTKFVNSRLYRHLLGRNGSIVYVSGCFAKRGDGVHRLLGRPGFRIVHRSVICPCVTRIRRVCGLTYPTSPVCCRRSPVGAARASIVNTVGVLTVTGHGRTGVLRTSASRMCNSPLVRPRPRSC